MKIITKRHFLQTSLFTMGAALLPNTSIALSEGAAKSLIDRVVIDINKGIASGRPLNAMISDFEKIFRRYADVNIIARSTLGADANRASASQLSSYTNAFRGYIARKYGKRFHEFIGGRVEVKSVRKVKSWQEVKTTVYLKGQSPFTVLFLVSDRSGKDLFFDMVIEGISLRLTERTEIGAMLDNRKGDINRLITDLKKAG